MSRSPLRDPATAGPGAGSEDEWPTAARRAEVGIVDVALAQGRSILFAGAVGIGKTRLVRLSLEHAVRRGYAVTELTATRAVSGLPFGAFMGLPGAELDDSAGAPALLYRELARGAGPEGSGRLLFGVDDAHLLDADSADLLHHLVVSGRASLVASVETGAAVPEGISRLWLEGRAERVDLGPFDPAGVAAVLGAALRGDIDPGTLERLHRATRGNALLLRELAGHALAEGSLRRVGGTWHWTGLAGVSGRLAELVRGQFGALAADERELVSMVALAEPVAADLPVIAALRSAAEPLNRRGILAAEQAGAELRLRLAYPLYSMVVAATLPELTARRLRLRLADAIEQVAPRGSADRSRAVLLRIDAGEPPPAADVLAAAETAARRADSALAERLYAAIGTPAGAPYQAQPPGNGGRALQRTEGDQDGGKDHAPGVAPPAPGAVRGTSHRAALLTVREREIALLAAAGQSNRAIAERLVVSVRTVENHLQRAYGKLGIGRRLDLPEALA